MNAKTSPERWLLPALCIAVTNASSFGATPRQGHGAIDPDPGAPPTAGGTTDGFVECTRTLYELDGAQQGSQFGWVSSPIPDVTGDGVPELAITAPFTNVGGNAGAGRFFLHDGASGVRLFRRSGRNANENLGYSVRDAGDVDGDGTCDIIVGARGNATTAGRARIYSGDGGGQIRNISLGALGNSFGDSVTGIGDVNGDGFDDIAVGATLADAAGTNAGRVYVVSGIDGLTLLWAINGEAPGDNFGSALGKLEDVTGDGLPELIVGAMNGGPGTRGKAYLFDPVAQTEVYSWIPDATGSGFGQFFVADVGDVDDDGFHDAYVGDFADGGGRGKAYVFSGQDGSNLHTIQGRQGDGFGIGRGAGDVDGDGHDDLLLCGWTHSSGAAGAGRADVYSGRTGNRLRRITSTVAGEGFGFDAHGIDDVNGDGHGDFVVTAASNMMNTGRVYVLSGRRIKENFGTGVAGTGGIEPTIAFQGCPRRGESVSIELEAVRGGAFGCLVIGTTQQNLPVLGGTLYTDLDFLTVVHRASGTPGDPGAGTRAFTIPVPDDMALIGQDFFAQAAYHDPETPAGLSFTDALRFTTF